MLHIPPSVYSPSNMYVYIIESMAIIIDGRRYSGIMVVFRSARRRRGVPVGAEAGYSAAGIIF